MNLDNYNKDKSNKENQKQSMMWIKTQINEKDNDIKILKQENQSLKVQDCWIKTEIRIK